jgi:hypothetical protein
MTLKDVIDHIRWQLDWRGPSGRKQGHIVLKHEEAEVLLAELEAFSTALDAAVVDLKAQFDREAKANG